MRVGSDRKRASPAEGPAVVLEVIVTDAAEAQAASKAGANRLELVAEREAGGVTPGMDTICETLAVARVPVRVMLRSRAGPFVYDSAEKKTMLDQARAFASAGVRGLVFGALTAQGRIDGDFLRRVIEAAGNVPVTFHRAFDELGDPLGGYRELTAFPAITHVLTSGAARDAWSGRTLLRELAALSGTPAVIAAGGVGPRTLGAILAETGVREVHAGSGVRIDGRLDASRIAAMALQLDSAAGRFHGKDG